MTESEGWSFSPTDIRKGFYCFSNMGVAGVMKEVKLSSVPNATLGCLPQLQMMKQDTFLLLLILLPSLSHPQWQLELTNGTGFRSAFAHLPQYTLFAPQTFSIHIVFNFSWDDYNTQEKLKTNMHEPLLQASSSPLPPLRMSRCKISSPTPQHRWLTAESIWAEAKIFCAHPAGCHSLSRIDGPTVFAHESPD